LKKFLIKILLFFFPFTINAQHYTHAIGVLGGVSEFQTDYGQRGNFASNFNNEGASFSVAHYLGFYKRNHRWNSRYEMYDYILIKTELNYIFPTKLTHYGKWVKGTSYLAEQLRAMHGSISMLNLGVSLEYYLKNLLEFEYPYPEIKWNPFVTFGLRYAFYKNDIVSDLGDWRSDITVLPQKYRIPGNLDVGSGGAFAFNLGAGIRYRLTEKLDLATQLNWQVFFSDAIDGLQAKVIENRNNDWLFNFQFGIIYHLNYNRPLFN